MQYKKKTRNIVIMLFLHEYDFQYIMVSLTDGMTRMFALKMANFVTNTNSVCIILTCTSSKLTRNDSAHGGAKNISLSLDINRIYSVDICL